MRRRLIGLILLILYFSRVIPVFYPMSAAASLRPLNAGDAEKLWRVFSLEPSYSKLVRGQGARKSTHGVRNSFGVRSTCAGVGSHEHSDMPCRA